MTFAPDLLLDAPGEVPGAEPVSTVPPPPASAARARNDARAFRGMYDEHVDFVWRNLRRLGVAEADVDDRTQEVFVVAHRRFGSFEAVLRPATKPGRRNQPPWTSTTTVAPPPPIAPKVWVDMRNAFTPSSSSRRSGWARKVCDSGEGFSAGMGAGHQVVSVGVGARFPNVG